MESNWRTNIALMGMTGAGWRLAARYNDDPTVILVSLGGPPLVKYRIYFQADPDTLPVPVGPIRALPSWQRFPYGEDVEPD